VKRNFILVGLLGLLVVILLFSFRFVPEHQSAIEKFSVESLEKLSMELQSDVNSLEKLNDAESLTSHSFVAVLSNPENVQASVGYASCIVKVN